MATSAPPGGQAQPEAAVLVPARIQPLPKLVVDKIAAGEVVQRPASIAKELIENSLDAGSTTIDVQCQAGGMRLLTVADDGGGISPPDLALAATRFATSKLVRLDDLRSIRTFGFRGEALASASMVARLSIVSRKRRRTNATANTSSGTSSTNSTLDDDEKKYSTSCAYKQSYKDGKPTAAKPTPSAGRDGTTIRVEVGDLSDFYALLPSYHRCAFTSHHSLKSSYLGSVLQHPLPPPGLRRLSEGGRGVHPRPQRGRAVRRPPGGRRRRAGVPEEGRAGRFEHAQSAQCQGAQGEAAQAGAAADADADAANSRQWQRQYQ